MVGDTSMAEGGEGGLCGPVRLVDCNVIVQKQNGWTQSANPHEALPRLVRSGPGWAGVACAPDGPRDTAFESRVGAVQFYDDQTHAGGGGSGTW